MGDGRVAVGIKNSRRSVGALTWALDNLVVAGDEIFLIHVRRQIHHVPTPIGKLAVAQLAPEKVAAYVKTVQDKIDSFVVVFKKLCEEREIRAQYVQVESDNVHKALVNQISVLGIQKLVLGGRKGLKRTLSGPGVGRGVASHAPKDCEVLLVRDNKLLSRREGDDSRSLSRGSESDVSDVQDGSTSSSSSQDTEAQLARLHGLPQGLGQRWDFITRLVSEPGEKQQPLPPDASPKTPLDQITDGRVFLSPFREAEPDTCSSESGVSVGTVALITHKLGVSKSGSSSSSGSKSVSGALSKLGRLESCSSSGTKSVGSSESEECESSRNQLALKAVRQVGEQLSGLDITSQSSDNVETPPTPPRTVSKRKSLRELAHMSSRSFREYSYEELEAATCNFSDKLKLGEGGYGLVYKGKLHGKDVAVKVLKKEGFQRTQEFQHEVELLGRIQHPHMVVLLGCCSQRGCLVYEYMANGSLDDRLFCKDGTPPLPWYSRLRIAAEVAAALHFLHNLGPEPVVHRDLKPANVLLDLNNVSKVADVGLAKLVPERLAAINSTYFRDTTPVGTFAYIDPEYQRTGLFGPKSDVYALGVVILQLLTGKPPVGVHAVVEEAIECGNFSSVLDQSAGDWPVAKAEEVACLALQCAEMKRRQRPGLETVLPMLEGARNYAENFAAITATNKVLARDAAAVIPSIFLCPIFQEVMEEPVVAADGYTYEYEAIRQWFQAHDTSPLTNLKLEHKQLTPHHALHKLIGEWKGRNKT